MLTLHPLGSANDKRQWLADFDPARHTWLVSDLKSKIEIQKSLLQRFGVLEEDSVLRASELWKKLCLRIRPDIRLVQLDLVRAQVQEALQNEAVSWAHGPSAAQGLLTHMEQLLPLLAQANGHDLLEEWWSENPDAVVRWRHWFELSCQIWERLSKLGHLPSTWAPALLLNEQLPSEIWPRRILLDLSGQISAVEVDLVRSLSAQTDVEVLVPSPNWQTQYPEVASLYRRLAEQGSAEVRERVWEELRLPGSPQLRRFSTMLAEVKDAVATVRKWQESGVPAREIAVVAPDIEVYWALLAPYFEQEGVGVDKARLVRLQTLPAMQIWLARLRVRLGLVNPSDLEMASFAGGARPMDFERFVRLYAKLSLPEDLARDEKMAERFRQEWAAGDALTRSQWVDWVVKFWPDADSEDGLARLLQSLMQDCPSNTVMRAEIWLGYMQGLAGKMELPLSSADARGIHCLSLTSAEWLDASHLYVLGLTDQALRQTQSQGIGSADAAKIERDLGFVLGKVESAALEFEARWLLSRDFAQLVLSCAATDVSGGPLSPSLLWLLQAEEPKVALEQVQAPDRTRWDELQVAEMAQIAEIRGWSDGHGQIMEQAILQDLGELELESFAPDQGISLSASQLENYAQCPFLVAAQKVFHLSDLPSLDVDVDHMTKGRVVHALFERLTAEPLNLERSDAELDYILDELRTSLPIELGEARLWTSLRRRYREIGRRFLAFEKEWRRQFPETQTVGRELKIQGRLNPQTGELGRGPTDKPRGEETEALPLFSGSIDRVDRGPNGEYVVLDYKSSGAGLTNYGSWLANQDLQLGLYAMALEEGLTDLPAGLVSGAFYYVVRTMNRDKGFQVDGPSAILPTDKKRRSWLSFEQRQKLFEDLKKRVAELARAIGAGAFAPQPLDEKTCGNCPWRQICRAPHLN